VPGAPWLPCTLDLTRRCDLSLQLHLTSRGGLYVCVGRLAQHTCPCLCSLSKKLHVEQQKSSKPHGI
jgi:hypothetical protein